MRLDDASSPRNHQQQHLPAPTSQPQPQAPQVPVPTPRPDVMQQYQMVRQCWPQPQPQPQPQSHGIGETSAAAKYASFIGSRSPSSFFASHYGAYSPRFNASTPTLPAVAPHLSPIAPSHPLASPLSSMPGSSTSHCQPTPRGPQLGASFSACDHNASLNLYGSMMPDAFSHNASFNQYACHNATFNQPRAAAASFAPHDNASMDPYAYKFLSAPHANQLDYQPWMSMPSVRRPPTLQEIRSRLLRRPMEPELAMSPQTAAHVVRLLEEGREEVRLSVLAGVKHAVHVVMGCNEGHAVFLALLRASAVRLHELQGIIQAVCGGKDCLLSVLKHDHGVRALKGLIMAVAPYHQLCVPLIVWVLGERLSEHCKGGELLHYCFATIPYETCSIMIRVAIHNIEEMLSSSFGSIYLAECFVNAKNGELRALEQIVLTRTNEIAKGQYSNYFLQRVLECGNEPLKERVAECVAADVASLSADKFGSYVVESCFLLTCSLAALRRVLAAFMALRADELAELVQGGYSNYVVHKLLATGKMYFPEQTLALAWRIVKLPAAVHREMHAQRVMQVVKKLFPRKLRTYSDV